MIHNINDILPFFSPYLNEEFGIRSQCKILKIFEEHPDMLVESKRFFRQIRDHKDAFNCDLNSEGRIRMYYITQILSLRFPILRGSFINLWVKFMLRVLEGLSPSKIKYVVQIAENLGIKIQILPKNYVAPQQYLQPDLSKVYAKIHYTHVFGLIPHNEMSMYIGNLSGGYVHISKTLTLRLLRARLTSLLHKQQFNITEDHLLYARKNFDFNELCMYVEKIANLRIEETTPDLSNSPFPPCMRRITSRAAEGINLTNTERTAIEFYMLQIGYPEDMVINVFRGTPDFNERTSAYFVKHAHARGYKPYNCQHMQMEGLCIPTDPICKSVTIHGHKTKIKNPLNYHFWKNKEE